MDLLELIKVIKELNASMIQLRAEVIKLSCELAILRQAQEVIRKGGGHGN